MAWVYLDDQFPDHPKIAAAGGDAGWLFVCGLAYCKRYGTDGFIPAAQVPRLTDRRTPGKLASVLVSVALWEVVEGGWQVHNYLEWNRSSDARSEAGRKAAAARWHRNGNATGNANASETHMPQDAQSLSHPLGIEPTSSTTDSRAAVDNDAVAVARLRCARIGKPDPSDAYLRSVVTSMDLQRLHRLVADGWPLDEIDRMLEAAPTPAELGQDPLADTLRAQRERIEANAAYAAANPDPERDPHVIADGLGTARAALGHRSST